MSLLSIKVDQFASLRQLRKTKEPDPAQAAVFAELAGADGITCHLREDRRHIRDRDIYILKEIVKSKLTIQVTPDEEIISRVIEVKPWMVTLMPGIEELRNSVRGINLADDNDLYADTVSRLHDEGINVGYFVDPDIDAIKSAARADVESVEICATDYSSAPSMTTAEAELDRLDQMARLASKLGMITSCAGGLNFHNIRPLAELESIEEFTVGHAIIARASLVGVDRSVREMAEMVHNARRDQ
jgi:pyridoxine 5-phosphate synthase